MCARMNRVRSASLILCSRPSGNDDGDGGDGDGSRARAVCVECGGLDEGDEGCSVDTCLLRAIGAQHSVGSTS